MDVHNHPLSLVMQVGRRLCALPLSHVAEIMRPLPVQPIGGASEVVRGAAVIREQPLPVVDMRRLLEDTTLTPPAAAARFVVVNAGGARVALAVDAVCGVHALAPSALPALLCEPHGGPLDALALRDSQLVSVLESARLLPEGALPAAWQPAPQEAGA